MKEEDNFENRSAEKSIKTTFLQVSLLFEKTSLQYSCSYYTHWYTSPRERKVSHFKMLVRQNLRIVDRNFLIQNTGMKGSFLFPPLLQEGSLEGLTTTACLEYRAPG